MNKNKSATVTHKVKHTCSVKRSGKKNIAIAVPIETWNRFNEGARRENRSLSNFMQVAALEKLEKLAAMK